MATSVRDKIADRFAKISQEVEVQVVDNMVEREIDKRADAIVKVVEKIEIEEKNLKKIDKPDQVQFGRDGKPISETFSKNRLDEIEKSKKKIEKMAAAIDKALTKGDMQDVYNLAAGKDSGGSEQKGDGEANG